MPIHSVTYSSKICQIPRYTEIKFYIFRITEPDAHGKPGYLNTVPLGKDWEWGIKHAYYLFLNVQLSISHNNVCFQTGFPTLPYNSMERDSSGIQRSEEPLSFSFSECVCVSAGNLTAVDTRSIKRLIFLVFCSWFKLWGVRTISQREAAGQRDGLGHL